MLPLKTFSLLNAVFAPDSSSRTSCHALAFPISFLSIATSVVPETTKTSDFQFDLKVDAGIHTLQITWLPRHTRQISEQLKRPCRPIGIRASIYQPDHLPSREQACHSATIKNTLILLENPTLRGAALSRLTPKPARNQHLNNV